MAFEMVSGKAGYVIPLLKTLPNPLNALSIAEGNTPGSIFVDNEIGPKAVMVWERGNGLFLAGNPVVEEFADLLKERIIPTMAAAGRGGAHILHTDEWKGKLGHLLRGRPVEYETRRIYVLKKRAIPEERNVAVPKGYDIVRADRAVLSSGMKGADVVASRIRLTYGDETVFHDKGGGFCALTDGGEVAGWCLFEYPFENVRCLGVEVLPGHKRKGVASALAAACLEYARSREWGVVWSCWEASVASWRCAEKVGFAGPLRYEQGRFLFG